MSGRSKLAALRAKVSKSIERTQQTKVEVEEKRASRKVTAKKAAPQKMGQVKVNEVDLGSGVSVDLAHDHSASWKKRLRDLRELAQAIAQNSVIEFEDAIRTLVKADGWVLTGGRMKTPLWMTLHSEIPIDSLEDDFKWLESCV